MEAKRITSAEAGKLVEEYKGNQFFTVTFTKRTNSKIRVMNCRKNVKKYLKGGDRAYDPKAKKLVFVWDVQIPDRAKAYRSIPLDAIKRISMSGGKEYVVIN
jgi:hypothetical protein